MGINDSKQQASTPQKPTAAKAKNPAKQAAEPTSAAPSDTSAFFMYVLTCADGTLYTGYTTDVEQRVCAHNAGKGAKYTRSRTPVQVVAQARFATKHEAMSAEYHFKRLSRSTKERLLARARTEDFATILAERWGETGEESAP